MKLLASLLFARHGQRPPYAPPFADSAEGPSPWSERAFPSHAAWGMTHDDFAQQLLTPQGHQLMRNIGEYVRLSLPPELGCSTPTHIVSDVEMRDVQSAAAFSDGFFASCPAERAKASLHVANGTLADTLRPIASDHSSTGCGPAEREALLLFGNHSDLLTASYAPQIERVGEVLGCCSAQLCARFGIAANCTLAELPTSYSGPDDYWDAMLTSPLTIAAYFAETFMLQALSGVQYAWGKLEPAELLRLYRLHDLVLHLAASRSSSEAFGSALIAYALASFEQVIHGAALPGLVQPPSETLFLAAFVHDLNLMYVQRLLGGSWLTDSWPIDSTPPGGFITLELWAIEPQPTPPDAAPPAQTEPLASPEGYRVRASFTSASFEQQRRGDPLVPPHTPPSVSPFLDLPYSEFTRVVLSAIDRRCIAQPLRGTVELLAPHDLMVSWLASRLATISALAIFAVGVACGGFLGFQWRHRLADLLESMNGRASLVRSPPDNAYTSFITCRAGTP
ncbi:hypothetical protein AB1Y20_020319 [Prymnesium parvum]|uniref:Acid phosphatase n=1 Tax=Prymnesium parvum TaxID=97485 RepID=A0AB34JX34_PRYPA